MKIITDTGSDILEIEAKAMGVDLVPVGGTVVLYLLLRFVFDTYIVSNVKERFFLHCIFLLPIKPVFPMFDSMPDSVRLNADTIYAVC